MNTQRASLFDNMLVPGEYPVPADAQLTMCRSCGAAIVWAKTGAGKPIPLSMKTARTVNGRLVALTHFSDCPHGLGVAA